MAFFSAVSSAICILLLPESRHAGVARRTFRASVSHRLIQAVIVFQFMNSFANGMFMVFLPLAAAALLSLSSTVIGIIISLSIFTTALFQRYSGGLADRYSRTLLVTMGSIVVGGALIAVPFTGSALLMLAVALLIGAGSGIAIPSATAIATVAGREIGQGAAMGAYNTASSAGMIVAPIISGAIMDAFGLAPVFYFAGSASLLAVIGFRYVIGRESTH
jgi:MFS family permease